MDTPWITVQEACKFLGVSRNTLHELRKRHPELKPAKLTDGPCGAVRFDRRALEIWMEGRK